MLRLLAASFVAFFLLSNSAMAQSCSGATWTPLTNGYPADASQVMNNFKCVLSSPSFSGNVGIGLTSPGTTLNIAGPNSLPSTSGSVSTDTAYRINNTVGGAMGGALDIGQYGLYGSWLQSRNAGNYATNYSLLLNPNGGNVGIGLTSPGTTLNIEGPASLPSTSGSTSTDTAYRINNTSGGATGGTLDMGQDGTAGSWLQSRNAGNYATNFPLLLNPNGGNVGIGTTTPAQALEVNGQVRVDTLASASSTNLCITATSDGVLATCSSSIRYKENVKDATFGLKEIMAMHPVTFKWKGRDEQDFGLIAEEVAKINPLFTTYRDGRIEGVKYPQLIAVLVNAVKELTTMNDNQARDVVKLKAQNAGQARVISALQIQETTQISQLEQQLAIIQRRLALRTASK